MKSLYVSKGIVELCFLFKVLDDKFSIFET